MLTLADIALSITTLVHRHYLLLYSALYRPSI